MTLLVQELPEHQQKRIAFGQHRSSSKSGSHMEQVLIESVPPEDVPRVESALLRLAELRKERQSADLPNQVADVRVRFSVSRDPDGRRVRIVYRKNRPVFGVVMLGVVLAWCRRRDIGTMTRALRIVPIVTLPIYYPVVMMPSWMGSLFFCGLVRTSALQARVCPLRRALRFVGILPRLCWGELEVRRSDRVMIY